MPAGTFPRAGARCTAEGHEHVRGRLQQRNGRRALLRRDVDGAEPPPQLRGHDGKRTRAAAAAAAAAAERDRLGK